MSETQSGSKRQGTSRQGTSQLTRSSHGRTAKVCLLVPGHSRDRSQAFKLMIVAPSASTTWTRYQKCLPQTINIHDQNNHLYCV